MTGLADEMEGPFVRRIPRIHIEAAYLSSLVEAKCQNKGMPEWAGDGGIRVRAMIIMRMMKKKGTLKSI